MKNSVYLHDIPLVQALDSMYMALREVDLDGILGVETIPLDINALGRILAEPVWAKISSPHYHSAAMDGFAVTAGDTVGASLNSPLTLVVGEQARYVDTGDVMPEQANAVIPIEEVEALDVDDQMLIDERNPAKIKIRSAYTPWAHVRAMGEDMVATQLVLPSSQKLRPTDLGAIAASGHSDVTVVCRPKVAIIPTGTELVEIGQPVAPGNIIEFNSLVLAAQIEQWGGQPTRLAMLPDDFNQILNAVKKASAEYDLVLLNAGSSAGSEDYSAAIVEELGELLVHGVAVRPGHPVILGMIYRAGTDKKVPIIGVPGYPVSAAITGELFVKHLMEIWLGASIEDYGSVDATIARKITSPGGDDDFVRVAVGYVGEKLLAAPLARGAGVISSLVRADGLALIPSGSQGVETGQQVRVKLYRNRESLDQTIFSIGSHDIALDIIAQYLAKQNRKLTSANVGSLAGLVSLARGEAHFSGSHLLDPKTGEYNLKYVREYLKGIPVKIVALVEREQGLIVRSGNPQKIKSLQDLTKEGVRFVNRQRGAGTRVRFDYEIDILGIAAENILGYEHEEYTHLSLAAAIASGRADCGLGIAAAAQALELDFIPQYTERYDLIIPSEHYESDLLRPLIDLLENANMKADILSLPGYNINSIGNIIANLE